MRLPVPLVILIVLVFWAAGAMHAQISNPIAEPIVKRGLNVEIRDVARLPDTRGLYPADQDAAGWARVSYVRDLADGRRFANDSRGFLYLLDRDNRPSLYADIAAACRVGSSFSSSTRNLHRSGSSTRRMSSRQGGIPRRRTSFRRGSRKPMSPFTVSSRNGARRNRRRTSSRAPGVSCSASDMSSTTFDTPSAILSSTRRRSPVTPTTACSTRAGAILDSAMAAGRMRAVPARPSALIQWSAQSCGSIRRARPSREGPKESGITRFQRSTSSPRMAIPRRSGRSTPTASGTPTGSRGISWTGRCSSRTLA